MNGFCDPFFFLPTFYLFKESIRQMPDAGTFERALSKYRENCFEDVRNSWMVWIPGHAVTCALSLASSPPRSRATPSRPAPQMGCCRPSCGCRG